jgi:hypothetical protein
MLAAAVALLPPVLPSPPAPIPPQIDAGCYAVPITPNTPTGIAGCARSGAGIGSTYGSAGFGVAMNFCSWTRRHARGCGSVTIYAPATGVSVRAPVVDFCDCYTGTADERIVDMLPAVVDALGLDRSGGLWRVVVSPAM